MNEREENILLRAGETIEKLGLRWKVQRHDPLGDNGSADVLLELVYPGGQVEFLAEVKARPMLRVGDELAKLRRVDLPSLIVADYVNPRLAEQFREIDVNFVDAAGNACIRHGGLYIWATGEKDTLRIEVERERLRAFQPSGLKTIFALLCRTELAEADYRTIAKHAGVALGTVQWVMRDLIKEGYVLRLGRFHRRLVKPKELLDAWVIPYSRYLRPRLLLGRFEATELNWWREIDPRSYDGLWGGEPAAALLTRYLKPGSLTIFSEAIPVRLVVEKGLEKREAGRVDFRRPFWRVDTHERNAETVPPILVYADLLALDDTRTREAAERIYEELIDGPFHAHLSRWSR